MMNADSLKRLLVCLADGQVHSGESLGAALGVSRAAIWKHIKAARLAGVPLLANRGEGYSLESGFELLNANAIKQACSPDTVNAFSDIQVFITLDSTNSQMMRIFQEGSVTAAVVLAEKQTAGRGRRGRAWHSPFAGSIYLTLGWTFTEGIAAIEGLSLVAGLKVVEVLQRFGAKELQLKWPNDVYWQQRKLAGILIDVQGDPAGVCQVAIGIGININLQTAQTSLIDQPWVDLVTVLDATGNNIDKPVGISRNTLVAALLDELVATLKVLPGRGFAAYQRDWQTFDVCYGQDVMLQCGNILVTGRACGVNVQGAYGIETASGKQYVSGGEISLRLVR